MKDINSYIVWTAIITPMNADSSVDYESLGNVLREQEAAGNGITLLGSTGEALNIDEAERGQILDFTFAQNLSVPIMVGVGGINIHLQTKWIEHLNQQAGISSYLLVVPPYAKPGVHGQYQWFKTFLDLAKKPCVIYNVPSRTAKKLEFETVKMLLGHPNFWAIKEASGSLDDFKKFVEVAPSIHMLSGEDATLAEQCKLGCKGVISVVSNAWPVAAHEWAKQCVAGTLSDTEVWPQAVAAIFSASSPVPTKALLHDQARIKTPQVRLPLSSQDMPDIEIVRKANIAITTWLNQTKNLVA